MDPAVLAALPESEINRQTIIQKLISKEVQYLKDLDVIESVRFPMLGIVDGILPLTVFYENRSLFDPCATRTRP